MLNITITEQTPHNMLRAIRAACNELLDEQERPKAVTAAPTPMEQLAALDQELGLNDDVLTRGSVILESGEEVATASIEVDSTGAEWDPELHASTKAKNQDGTWKKRRGAGKAEDAPEPPALPPLPPTDPAATLVTMNDIYALITNGKAVLNDVIAAAQAMGFADVGAFSRDATPEQRAQLLRELTA